jgi:hypothetical protein
MAMKFGIMPTKTFILWLWKSIVKKRANIVGLT